MCSLPELLLFRHSLLASLPYFPFSLWYSLLPRLTFFFLCLFFFPFSCFLDLWKGRGEVCDFFKYQSIPNKIQYEAILLLLFFKFASLFSYCYSCTLLYHECIILCCLFVTLPVEDEFLYFLNSGEKLS